MNRAPFHGMGQVLAAGARLFRAGLSSAFPWILAAELLQALPFASGSGNVFTMDLSLLAQPAYLARALSIALLQALLYSIAVLRLAAVAGEPAAVKPARGALRAVPAVLIGYLAYELVVAAGLMFAFVAFVIGLFIAGWQFGLALCILPLAPTAAASTALALFVFPAVLDRRGPFDALGESWRLAKRRWGRVSLVISVPALALLAAWCVQNGPALLHAIRGYLDFLSQHAEEGISAADLEKLQGSLESGAAASHLGAWQLAGMALGALAWWYTLAVCYAQYRDLRQSEAV